MKAFLVLAAVYVVGVSYRNSRRIADLGGRCCAQDGNLRCSRTVPPRKKLISAL